MLFPHVERADIENGDDEAAITCAFAAIRVMRTRCRHRGRVSTVFMIALPLAATSGESSAIAAMSG